MHAVIAVGVTVFVNEERPGKGCFLHIAAGEIVGLEGDHHNPDIPPVKFPFMIAQLREVLPAGESAEMAMEDHQEPVPPVAFEVVAASFDVTEVERDGGFPS